MDFPFLSSNASEDVVSILCYINVFILFYSNNRPLISGVSLLDTFSAMY